MRTRKISVHRALAGLALTATIAVICTLLATAPSANASYPEPTPEPVVVVAPPPPPPPKPEPVVHQPEPVDHKIDERSNKAKDSVTSYGQSGLNIATEQGRSRAIALASGQAVGAGVAPAEQGIDDPAVVTDTAGPANSIWAEYVYLNINDGRPLGLSGDSHGLQVGYDLALPSGLVLGAIYGYDRRNLDSGGLDLSTKTDTHVLSAFVAQSFLENFSVGLVGGYSNIDTEANLRTPGITRGASVDAWNISPFLGAAYTNGALSAYGNLNYVYYDAADTSQKIGIEGGLGYALTEQVSVTGYVGYNYMVDQGNIAPDLPAMEWWFAFGAKLSARLAEPLEIYAAYEYDLYDDSDVNTHVVRAGLAFHF